MKQAGLEFAEGRIHVDPDICNGRPTIRGTRIAVESILDYLGAGDSEADVLAAFPDLEVADVRACLGFAVRLMHQRYDLAKVA